MRIIITSLILSLATVAIAQTGKSVPVKISLYDSTMLTNIKKLDTATGSSFFVLANNFERIGNAEKTKWEPFYYAAYCYSVMAFMSHDKTKIDWLADKGDSYIQQAEVLEKNNAELSCLASMLTATRILVDPIGRFPVKGKEVTMLLEKAKRENPDNPRIYLQEAIMQLRTPEAFGGGKKIARASIEKSLQKFDTFIPATPLSPSWGKTQAKSLLEKILTE
jgi:hypothetical protein